MSDAYGSLTIEEIKAIGNNAWIGIVVRLRALKVDLPGKENWARFTSWRDVAEKLAQTTGGAVGNYRNRLRAMERAGIVALVGVPGKPGSFLVDILASGTDRDQEWHASGPAVASIGTRSGTDRGHPDIPKRAADLGKQADLAARNLSHSSSSEAKEGETTAAPTGEGGRLASLAPAVTAATPPLTPTEGGCQVPVVKHSDGTTSGKVTEYPNKRGGVCASCSRKVAVGQGRMLTYVKGRGEQARMVCMSCLPDVVADQSGKKRTSILVDQEVDTLDFLEALWGEQAEREERLNEEMRRSRKR